MEQQRGASCKNSPCTMHTGKTYEQNKKRMQNWWAFSKSWKRLKMPIRSPASRKRSTAPNKAARKATRRSPTKDKNKQLPVIQRRRCLILQTTIIRRTVIGNSSAHECLSRAHTHSISRCVRMCDTVCRVCVCRRMRMCLSACLLYAFVCMCVRMCLSGILCAGMCRCACLCVCAHQWQRVQ